MKNIIVSRHPAAVEFIRAELGSDWASAPVIESASEADVIGAVVAGNLPLHLAAKAAQVIAVEFSGPPPRGTEYGIAEMRAAGAKLARYTVEAVAPPEREVTFNDGRKSRGHTDRLFVGRGGDVREFVGESISGIVAVSGRRYEKNGKWSNTTYTLRLATDAWHLVSSQSWEEGERFHGCSSIASVIQQFRTAGCTAPDAAITACLDQSIPTTMERIRRTEAELLSVQ